MLHRLGEWLGWSPQLEGKSVSRMLYPFPKPLGSGPVDTDPVAAAAFATPRQIHDYHVVVATTDAE